jgi:serine/threonine protein phosphatase PrpC
MKCPKCGYESRGGASFCQFCGAPLPAQAAPAAQASSEQDVSQQPTRPLPTAGVSSKEVFSSRSDTRPLPQEPETFAPLPQGAFLLDGRYMILEVRGLDEQPHVYLAEDTTPTSVCPNCRSEVSDPEEQFCTFCGADLAGAEPLRLRYLIRESADEQTFAVEAQLLRMRLEHPGLLLPRDVFAEAPYGSSRYYLVESEFLPPLATSLVMPQKLGQVLAWGVSLARALSYLHRHQLTLQGASLEHIAVDGASAYWVRLGVARVIPPDARSQSASYFIQDVRGLASALYYMATGGTQYDPQAAMPEQVAAVFAQTLASPQGLADASHFGEMLEAALQEVRRPASVNHIVGRRTDVGRERSLNEDSLLAVDIAAVYRSESAPIGFFAVADGMGGHEAGDAASHTAISALAQQVVADVLRSASADAPLPDPGVWLAVATEAANQAVYDRRSEAGTDMGTTLVAALLIGDTATISNVGDSRAYLLTSHGITQVTTDHSLVARLVATGQITREEAANHPQKNVIYRVIGDRPRAEGDIYEQQVAPGEALLLCSDGLSGMVPDAQIWHTWRTSTSPQEACDRLVEAANEAGGEDNITVVIVQVSQ